MKWKWALRGALVLIIIFLLLQSPIVERPVASWLEHLAEKQGYEITIGKLDFNLLALECRLQSLSVQGPGIQSQVSHIDINAAIPVLMGHLVFDQIELADGWIVVNPLDFPKSENEKPSSAFNIKVGSLSINEVRGQVIDKSIDLNLDLHPIEVRYENSVIDLDTDLVLSDTLKPLADYFALDENGAWQGKLTLRAHTENFMDFDQVKAHLNGTGVDLILSGFFKENKPDLKLNGEVQLIHSSFESPLTLDARVADGMAVNICSQILMSGEPTPLVLSAYSSSLQPVDTVVFDSELAGFLLLNGEFNMSNRELLCEIETEDQALTLLGKDLDLPHGRFVGVIHGNLDSKNVGNSFLQGMGVLEADNMSGGCAFITNGNVQGDFQLFPEEGARIQGGIALEKGLENGLGYVLANGKDFSLFPAIPEQLTTSDFLIQAQVDWNKTWRQSLFDLSAAMNTPAESGIPDLQWDLHASGLPQEIHCQISGEQDESPVLGARFKIDLYEESYEDLELEFGNFPMVLDALTARINGRIEGRGLLNNPSVQGDLHLEFQNDETGPFEADCRLMYQDSRLHVPALQVSMNQVEAFGNAFLDLASGDPELNILVQRNEQDPRLAMVQFDLPEFYLDLDGDAKSMLASWWLPDQELTIQPDISFRVFGENGNLKIGGVEFEKLKMALSNFNLRLDGQWRLRDSVLAQHLLNPYVEGLLALNEANGSIQLTYDLLSDCLNLNLAVEQAKMDAFETPMKVSGADLRMDESVACSPFKIEIGGETVDVKVNQLAMDPFSLDAEMSGNLKPGHQLGPSLSQFLPEGMSVKQTQLKGRLWINAEKPDPKVEMDLQNLTADYMDVELRAEKMVVALGDDYRVSGEGWTINGEAVDLEETGNGLRLSLPIKPVMFPELFAPRTGQLDVLAEVSWGNPFSKANLYISLNSGPMTWDDPALSLQKLNVELGAFLSPEGELSVGLTSCQGQLNGGMFDFQGSLFPLDQVKLELMAQNIPFFYRQNQIQAGGSLELVSVDDKYELSGAVVVNQGQFFPDFTLSDLVNVIAPPYPSLDFPDPMLDKVFLNLEVHNVNPVAFSHSYGYLELAMPSLVLSGTLAIPELTSGFIQIEPDSYLKLGNTVFLFKPSEVFIQPERPGDPYLQLFLEYGRENEQKDLQLTGYLSDLENSPDATSITSFLASFLLGKYTGSLLSLEYRGDQDITDSSFSAILEKQLARKVYTRYIVPLDLKKESQRIELGFGPFSDLFLSATQSVDELKYNAKKTIRFGGSNGRENKIKHVSWAFPEDLALKEKWRLKKLWPLKEDSTISEGRLRQSEKRFVDQLRGKGYLKPNLQSNWDDTSRRLKLTLQPGPKYQIKVAGLKLSDASRSLLLQNLMIPDQLGSRTLKRDLMAMNAEYGFLPGNPECRLVDHTVEINFNPGRKLVDYQLDLTQANAPLSGPLSDSKWRRDLILSMLMNPKEGKGKLRSLLAAKGYLKPRIGRGVYDAALRKMKIPVKLGDQAQLKGIEFYELQGSQMVVSLDLLQLIQDKLSLPPVDQNFDYTLLAKTKMSLEEQLGKNYLIDVKPRQRDADIWFQVNLRKKIEPVFHEIEFSGLQKLPQRSLYRLIQVKQDDSQLDLGYADLIQAQKRLLAAGPFDAVQLITRKDKAVFDLQERNRFDLGLGLSYSEQSGFSGSVQFIDRMFLRRPNEWAVRLESGHEEDRALMQFVFRNFFKGPGDFILYTNRIEQNQPQVSEFSDFGVLIHQEDYEISNKVTTEYVLSISARQKFSFGSEFQWVDRLTQIDEIDEWDGTLLDSRGFKIRKEFLPLHASWSFKSLDRNNNPRNGYWLSASFSYFLPDLSEEDSVGPRLSGSATYFKSFPRWTSSHRLKWGYYDPNGTGFFDLGENNPTHFYLGGSTTLRGYRANTVGPLDPATQEGLGGNAMFFFSEEWMYHTYFYGLSLAAFLDGGQVWTSEADVQFDDLRYSSGLGLIFDSPIGLLRVDYAQQLNKMNKEIEENWTLKFGTIF